MPETSVQRCLRHCKYQAGGAGMDSRGDVGPEPWRGGQVFEAA